MPLLEVDNLSVSYGVVPALRGISLNLHPGNTLGVVGANGAGKTTLSLALAGALKPVAGCIRFDGSDLASKMPEDVARMGMALIPEGRRIFEGMTVRENLMLGQTANPATSAARENKLAEIHMLFPILEERRFELATRLSGGEQQQLAIARALLSEPKLLILDEPSLGLAPLMVDRVYDVLHGLRAKGLSMILIEQNPARLGKIADGLIVLANGVVRMEGAAEDLLNDPDLAAVYLSGEGGSSP